MKRVSKQVFISAYAKLRQPFLSLKDCITYLQLECYSDGDDFLFPTQGKTFLGPFQFNRVTWYEVATRNKFRDSFSMVNDPFVALKFADAYARGNISLLRSMAKKKAVQLPDGNLGALAYLCHQQGASGAFRTLLTGKVVGKQSRASLALFGQLRTAFLARNSNEANV